LCAPLRIDSGDISKNSYCNTLEPGTQKCTYIKKNSAYRYIVPAAVVIFRTGSPKMARNEEVCVHQKSYRK